MHSSISPQERPPPHGMTRTGSARRRNSATPIRQQAALFSERRRKVRRPREASGGGGGRNLSRGRARSRGAARTANRPAAPNFRRRRRARTRRSRRLPRALPHLPCTFRASTPATSPRPSRSARRWALDNCARRAPPASPRKFICPTPLHALPPRPLTAPVAGARRRHEPAEPAGHAGPAPRRRRAAPRPPGGRAGKARARLGGRGEDIESAPRRVTTETKKLKVT